MEQHDGPHAGAPGSSDVAPSGSEGKPASGSKMRLVAIGATAIVLLAISIPFVWQPHAESAPAATIAADVTPAASHDPSAPTDPGACMADAKPANFDFTFKDLDGKSVPLSSYKGKIVLLNFWATWCGPCKAEIPGFVELQEKYKKDLVIVGFSVDDTADKARAFANQYKINYPVLLGEGNEELQEAYGPIWGIPASFLISKDGRVCRKHLGIAPKSVFEKEIVALM